MIAQPISQTAAQGLSSVPDTEWPMLGDAPLPVDGAVTPESMMIYCQARLDSLDGQVTAAFDQQQRFSDETQALKGLLEEFTEHKDGVDHDPTVANDLDSKLGAFAKELAEKDPTSPILKDIRTLADTVHSSNNDNNFDGTEMSKYITGLQNAIDGLNSNAQLQMIQVQSLMSQRQTAVTLTTNLVQSLGDQANKIAENIGR